jgi:hypothetical protein
MGTHRFLWAGLAVAGMLAAAGCRQNQQPNAGGSKPVVVAQRPVAKPTADAGSAATQPAGERPVITDPPGSTADALAQRANSYARNIEPLLNQRKAAPHGTDAPAMADASDQVQWIDPKGAHADPHGASDASPSKSSPERAAAKADRPEAMQPSSPPPNDAPAKDPAPGQPARRMQVASANVGMRAAASPPVSAEPTVDELTRRLAQHAKDYPAEVAGQFDYQLLQFVRGDSVPNLQDLAGLSNEDREMLSALLDGLTNFRSALRADNNMLLSRKIRPILDSADRLRTQAELSIPTVALCTDVLMYGNYKPIEPARLTVGDERKMCVYCEVANFDSQLDASKMWETKLRMDVVLYEDQGLEVWSPDRRSSGNAKASDAIRTVTDQSRTRRHDFFLIRPIRLPKTLGVGRYILKVTVVDLEANRVAENTLPLEIVAQ